MTDFPVDSVDMTHDPDLSPEEVEGLVGERPPTRGAIRRDWKLLPRALPYLSPYRKYAVVSVLITVLLAAVALAQPWPLAFVIDSVLGDKPVPGWIEPLVGNGMGALIALAVAATLLLTLLSGGMTVLNEYLTTTVDQRMSLDFRSDLFQHVQRLSLAYHDNTRTGMLMFRLNSQASAVGNIVVGLPVLAQSALTIGGMAFISFRIEPVLALLALGVTPFIFYSTTYYADRIEPRLYRVRGMEAMNMAIVHEAMQMLRVVLAFGHEGREFRRFRKQGEKTVDARVALTVRQTAFQLAVQLITATGTAAVLGVGAYQAVHGRITTGELVVVLTYIAQVYQPLEDLTRTLTAYQQYFISFRHAYDLLQEAPGAEEKPDARTIGRAHGEIELEGVRFGYTGRPDVLEDVSFRVPAGRAIAIVGPTGAGKSTLASLLPRFYDPDEGRVLLDGTDVRDLTLDSLRSQFSIVLQEPLLFSTTIFDNIRYGKPDASSAEVEAAAKAANAHDFISALPDGYETKLGERGAKISGGERQRIAVARAFLRDAPILILDEPTSSIDSRTESVILDALERLMEGRTAILIAHRLSTIRGADEILVMSEGQIVQRGRHEDLVREPGLYQKLWAAQTGAPAERDPHAIGADHEPRGDAPPAAPASNGDGRRAPAVHDPGERLRHALRVRAVAVNAAKSAGVRPKIVLLGMLAKHPYGGVAWQVGQYAVGFEQLGYEVHYVEAHAGPPVMFMDPGCSDGAERAARFIADFAARFGLGSRWAFQALHDKGHCFGMSAEQLDRLYSEAALIVNMHGGTLPLPEHVATNRLIFLGTDPVGIELAIHRGDSRIIEFLEHHVAFFSSALNFGNPDCRLPWTSRFQFIPSPPPVVLDFWTNDVVPDGAPFTTVGNWRQRYRDVRFEGRTYSWSKHQQFLRFLDLPRRAGSSIELALSMYDDRDHLLLAEHGWRVRPALEFSRDPDAYRDYIIRSAGEVSVAKEQNVHFRSGWFSERSATYLAAGRPVILQDTGFGAALPTGEGLFSFSDLDGAVEAIAATNADPVGHRRAARQLAREYLSHEVVLGDLLDRMGLPHRGRFRRRGTGPPGSELPHELPLTPLSTTPAALAEETAARVERRPVPAVRPPHGLPAAGVVMPVLDSLGRTRLALESLLAHTDEPAYEVVAVDIACDEETGRYLEVLASRNRHVTVVRAGHACGVSSALNQGLATAVGERLIVLASNTIVPPGWLSALTDHLADPAIGFVAAATDGRLGTRGGPPPYSTYREMLAFARARRETPRLRELTEGVTATPCAALRRDAFQAVGALDERFEIGFFALSDYARRVRDAGYRVAYAEDVFVHSFGKAEPAADGGDGELFDANRLRFEDKWSTAMVHEQPASSGGPDSA